MSLPYPHYFRSIVSNHKCNDFQTCNYARSKLIFPYKCQVTAGCPFLLFIACKYMAVFFMFYNVLTLQFYVYIRTRVIYSRGRGHERLDANPRHKSVERSINFLCQPTRLLRNAARAP